MDEPLEIPDAAYVAASRAFNTTKGDLTPKVTSAIAAAAPLIVAAKLRQILSEPRVSEWPGFIQIAINDIADDLDPEGLAR